jgi:hypothetical protein
MQADDAVSVAARLLAEHPPIDEPASVVSPAEDHDWCFVVHWTIASNLQPGAVQAVPPPGTGPVLVDTSTGAAEYLGSQLLATEVDQARARRHP